MSRASLRSKISLARRTEGRDHLIDALQRGRIGFEAAQLIARIASADTEQAWVSAPPAAPSNTSAKKSKP